MNKTGLFYEKKRSFVVIENEGYLRGLACALSIVRHSNGVRKAEQSIRNAIDQANLISLED